MTPTSPASLSDSGSPSALCLLCGASNPPSATSCHTCGSPLAPASPLYSDAGELSGFARALPSHTSLRNGDYRILGVLGQGGFGITYRASNQRLEREVAIKEFFPATCERVGRSVSASGGLSASDFDSLRAAFMEEARILARFELPAVVRVMGAWEENASAYMEMEILHGPTLAQVLEERQRLPIESTLRLFEPVIDALEAIHLAGWLHRDIKPHNIIFEPHLATPVSVDPRHMDLGSCRAVLLDFGAAKKVAANVSQSFSVIVTPGYAPLEQYATRARRGAFTDVYALCATLYHALSGQAPPPASDRALHDDLIPLRELRPEVPPVIARAIEEGLQTSIARRPQTMGDLRELLRGRGALQMAVQAAASEQRDPKAGQLKARQKSILSNIQSINQPGSGPYSTQEKLISSLPVSTEAMQMLQSATQSAAQAAAQNAAQSAAKPVAQQPGVPAAAIGKPLPTARPTSGAPGAGGGHRLEKQNAPGKWSSGAYMTAIGIGLLLLASAGRVLFVPGPPTAPPPIEAPYVVQPPELYKPYASPYTLPYRPHLLLPEPVPSIAHSSSPAIESVVLSPDGRYVFGRSRDWHGRVWDVASGRRVLDVDSPEAPLGPNRSMPVVERASWSPDSKYLLLLKGSARQDGASGSSTRTYSAGGRTYSVTASPRLGSKLERTTARLFSMETRRQVWEQSPSQEVETGLLSWELDRRSVWLGLGRAMRRFSIHSGAENTPPGSLAINQALRQLPTSGGLKLFAETPQWVGLRGRTLAGKSTSTLLSGELNSEEASEYQAAKNISPASLGDYTLASARGHWLLQCASTPGDEENVVRFVSFGGTLKREWRGKRSDDEGASFSPVASPDGRVVAHLRFSNLLRWWNLDTGEDLAVRFPGSSGPVSIEGTGIMLRRSSILSSNDDGSRWLIAGSEQNVRLFDTDTRQMLEAPGVSATAAAFSPSEKEVLWLNAITGNMGRLPLSKFTRVVRTSMVDAPTSRAIELAP